jgi:hypothetical protein
VLNFLSIIQDGGGFVKEKITLDKAGLLCYNCITTVNTVNTERSVLA